MRRAHCTALRRMAFVAKSRLPRRTFCIAPWRRGRPPDAESVPQRGAVRRERRCRLVITTADRIADCSLEK